MAGRLLELMPIAIQPYEGCAFSAGHVRGHPVDTIYLALERDGEEPTRILLRPDEAQAIAYCLNAALWSHLVEKHDASQVRPQEA